MRVAIAPEGTFFEIVPLAYNELRLILWDTDNGKKYWLDVDIDATDKYITRVFLALVKRYETAQKAEKRLGIYRVFPTKEEA